MTTPAETDAAAAAPPVGATGYSYLVAAFLALIYCFNFLDRQLLSILAEPIRKSLHLSDTQLGLLTGLAFVVFYTGFGIPVAWLADRTSRVRLIAAACALWSLFSASCGLTSNFAQLALARIGVGIGEAGGSPPSYSIISDYFPPRSRGVGLGLYSLGVPLGAAFGSALGGGIAAAYGWRAAFLALGAPGLILAVLALVVVREPVRGRLDPAHLGEEPQATFRETLAGFTSRPVLLATAASSGLTAFVGYAQLNWFPTFLMRAKGMTPPELALYYSLVQGVVMALGTFGSGWLVDRLARWSPRAYALVPAVALTLSLPLFVGFLLAPSWPVALAFAAGPMLTGNMYLAPALAVVQNAVSPRRRGTSAALLLFVLNLVGLGGGPLLVGIVSDHTVARFGSASLQIGLASVLPVVVLAVAAHVAASRAIINDPVLGRRAQAEAEAA